MRVCGGPNQVMTRGYKLVKCSTQLSMQFIVLANAKMPTIVGILAYPLIYGYLEILLYMMRKKTDVLIRLCGCAGWSTRVYDGVVHFL